MGSRCLLFADVLLSVSIPFWEHPDHIASCQMKSPLGSVIKGKRKGADGR